MSLKYLSSVSLFVIATAFFSLMIGSWVSLPKSSKPNVVLFFIDDLGYGDLSCTGAMGYTTPNLDRMAAEGSRFTNFLAAQAVCSASRASLLTGCYPNRIGISGALGPGSSVGLNPAEETLPELLKEQGYTTGIFGKWHLGDKPSFLPVHHGFDKYYGVPYSHDMWPHHPDQARANYPPLFLIDGNQPAHEVKTLEDASQLTATFTEKAISFISANRRKPFFLYMPYPMPHVPLAASTRFKGKSQRGLFGDVLMELDWAVGQIMQEIRQQGLDSNTLVLFISDNGPWLNYGDHAGSAGGLREGKGTTFEGGHRVPCLVRWPGVVPAGRVSNKLLTTMDVLPTVARLCGARLPKQTIDGVDWTALLKGNESVTPRELFYYYYRKNSLEAVRKGDWKLVFAHQGRTYEGFLPGQGGKPGPNTESHAYPMALYNLQRDPGERYDVHGQHPELMAELERIAEAARDDLGDDLQQRTGRHVRAAGKE